MLMHSRILIFLFFLNAHPGALIKLNAQDRSAVDRLNTQGWNFQFTAVRADSALKYAGLAYKEADKINYRKGKVLSMLIMADTRGRLLGDFAAMEELSRAAIKLLDDAHDSTQASLAWYKLAMALHSQGKYDIALEAAARAIDIAKATNDQHALGWGLKAAGIIYVHRGEFWKCFENMIVAQQIGKDTKDSLLTSIAFAFIGRCFNRAGDPATALTYYYQALPYATPFFLIFPHVEDIAFAHLQLKQYDSALWYQQLHTKNLNTLISEPLVKARFGVFSQGYSVDIRLIRGEFDAVISETSNHLQKLKETGSKDFFSKMQSLLLLSKAHLEKGNTSSARRFAYELLNESGKAKNRYYSKDAYQLISTVFDKMRRPDSAYHYYRYYVALKDSLNAIQFAQRTALYIAASEAQNKINLLEKDKTLNEQQLALGKRELQKQNELRNGLIIGLVVLSLLSALVIRMVILKKKNEKLLHEQMQMDLRRKALELEMQALRAQMNPHFIFNCLSAIDNLIQTSQPDKAGSWLSRFAHLIRSVLDGSKNNLVPFQKDFETLKLYLELEQFRCNYKFNYQLDADQELLNGDFKVPPLLVQPFVENAIHHGLLNKSDANRNLDVKIRLEDEHIVYSVTDNGVGRQLAAVIKERNRPEHQSYGIAITRERIQLHNSHTVSEQDVLITDLISEGRVAGTKAVVRISSYEN
jgi:tetratricopeptide (TPR) repeat protein